MSNLFLFYFVTSKVDQALGCELLSAMLPLGSQLLDAQSSRDQMETSLSAFEDFFESLVLLAGTNKDNGHLILAKAVEEWIPFCVNLVKNVVGKDQPKEEESSETVKAVDADKMKQASFIPVGAVFRYLSYLTSAVQFITNMVKCTEKRTLAGECDGPLCDSESEDEGEGLGGAEMDEGSQGEESVSVCTCTCRHDRIRLDKRGKKCFKLSSYLSYSRIVVFL